MSLGGITRAILAGLVLLVAACDDPERNIILERSPFFEDAMPYSSAETERVISSVRRFAEANGMDFLLARDSLPIGDYNATAAGRDLNLKVIHVGAINPKKTEISAYARSDPTESDQKKARAFACAVKGRCAL